MRNDDVMYEVRKALHLLWLPLLLEIIALLIAGAIMTTWWLGFTPSPLMEEARHWNVPANWNPTGLVTSGTLAMPAGWPLFLLSLALLGAAGAAFWLAWRARLLQSTEEMNTTRHIAPILIIILIMAMLAGMICLLWPVLPSDDLISYALYGRISTIYHANPLITTPDHFPGDPLLQQVFWKGTRAVYGPLWLIVSIGITGIAQALGGSIAVYTALYKLLGLACHLANIILIWQILGRYVPTRRVTGTILYALNPLPLIEFAASGHNDALMLTLLLSGILLWTMQHERWALVAWGCSIATKYIVLLLLPFWLWHVVLNMYPLVRGESIAIWKSRILTLAWRASIAIGTAVILVVPFWNGPQTLFSLIASPPAQMLDNSLMDSVSWPLRSLIGTVGHLNTTEAASLTINGLRLAGVLAFGAIYAVLLLRRAPTDLSGACVLAMLAYLVIGTGWFWPWYATWPLALAALRRWDAVTNGAVILAGSVLLLYSFQSLMALPIYGYRSLLAFGPLLGYGIWHWWRLRSSQEGKITPALSRQL
jgi:hypothetical protein